MNLFDGPDLLETTSTEVKNRILKPGQMLRAIDTGALYYGDKDGKPTAFVGVSTSDGGVGKRTLTIPRSADKLLLTPDFLRDAFPLPVLRNILDPVTVNIAGITKPAGVTVTLDDATEEMFGKALKIDLPSGLTNQKIVIPVPPDIRGNYPKALPRIEYRIKTSDYASIPRLYLWACENAAGSKGYLWSINDDSAGNSLFDLRNPALVGAWNGAYRTMGLTPYSNVSKITTPAQWDETAPEYAVQSICITVTTTTASTIWLNRVCCPEWERGALITQFDGGYKSAYPYVLEFARRGWPGVVSKLMGDSADYMSDAQYRDAIAGGFDVCQHVAKEPITPMDGAVTDAQYRSYIANWQRYATLMGLSNPGFRTCSSLTNSGQYSGSDAAGILRSCGVLGGRGRFSDAQFGVNPYNSTAGAAINGLELSKPVPGGWSPRWGRHNRHYQDASIGGVLGTGVDSRHYYEGSDTEKFISRIVAGRDCGWVYIHRIQDYDGVLSPNVNNISPLFIASYIEQIEAELSAGRMLPISATQADMLTYERPGDVYLAWDGSWRSRSTGKVAL